MCCLGAEALSLLVMGLILEFENIFSSETHTVQFYVPLSSKVIM